MSAVARVIGLGEPYAGDDGVGFAVIDQLQQMVEAPRLQLLQVRDAAALIPLLETDADVMLVDAVLGDRPGEILELAPEEIRPHHQQPVSSHGLGVAEVVALARALMPGRVSPRIRIIAVVIARPDRLQTGLSTAVSAAVPLAAQRVLTCLGQEERSCSG